MQHISYVKGMDVYPKHIILIHIQPQMGKNTVMVETHLEGPINVRDNLNHGWINRLEE